MAGLINSLTGTRMWVAPEREAEYRLADTGLLTIAVRGAKPTPHLHGKHRAPPRKRAQPEEMRNSNEIR